MYTKTVLTVIAIALSTIAVENVLTPAYAQGSIQKVMICDARATSDCADVSGGGALKVQVR